VVWRRSGLCSGRQLWPGCSALAAVRRALQQARSGVLHCSSPAWTRRCYTRRSGQGRLSADCARDVTHACGSCTPWRHSTGLLAAIACGHVRWGRSASQSTASNVAALLIGRKKSSEYLICLSGTLVFRPNFCIFGRLSYLCSGST